MDTTATKYIIGLDEQDAADPATSGRKTATLAALASQRPSGAARLRVTTAACERILATIDDAAEDLARAEFPHDVWAGIVSGLRRLGDGAVAVPSSATAEDLTDASYAPVRDRSGCERAR